MWDWTTDSPSSEKQQELTCKNVFASQLTVNLLFRCLDDDGKPFSQTRERRKGATRVREKIAKRVGVNPRFRRLAYSSSPGLGERSGPQWETHRLVKSVDTSLKADQVTG